MIRCRHSVFAALCWISLIAWCGGPASAQPAAAPDARGADGSSEAVVTGDLMQWHKVTLTLDGPWARETDDDPNPFTGYRFDVTFEHESGEPRYDVPGYFAADGDAAATSADAGSRWRAHLSPDKPGRWSYTTHFRRADATGAAGDAIEPFDGVTGTFNVAPTDKSGRDLRGKGRLEYVNAHFLRFAGDGSWFLKIGADSPETLLAYADFDNTQSTKHWVPLKTWQPHVADWREGDPTWQDGKGKGLIGAINYLADAGGNSMSFLTYNAGGDGDNVWPFVVRDDKMHYDVSKLDQWQIVFDHAQRQGLFLHFKLQETENDDNFHAKIEPPITASLDGGDLGPQRRLYLRELIARFGYELALNWNLGEENTQSPEQQRAMAGYIRELDPYGHPIVLHTFPPEQEKRYTPLLGPDSPLDGVSLQNPWDLAHKRTLQWRRASAEAGKPWVVCNDEQGHWSTGTPPDPGYPGFDGTDEHGETILTVDDVRKSTLWGNLMAGGAGVEHYFGWRLIQNDLTADDWRSRARTWHYGRIAVDFFHDHDIPFWEMANRNALVGNDDNDNDLYCLARDGGPYLVYLHEAEPVQLDLSGEAGRFSVRWFNPREGGPLAEGSVAAVTGGQRVDLGTPPADDGEDWLAVVQPAE